jgi:general transcription factor 3C polypeptide 3 (transcription factor C subunit 4)
LINITVDDIGVVDSQSDYLNDTTSDDDSQEESDADDIEVPQGVQAEIDTDFKYVISLGLISRV